MSEIKVPFMDLTRIHEPVKEELLSTWSKLIDRSAFVLGAPVAEFEKSFSEFIGSKYCVTVNSGYEAIRLALLAAGIGPGDEVITQANTFIATAFAISATGASPVLVDCHVEDFQISLESIKAAITERTKAIIPVHLYGYPAPMDEITVLAKEQGLFVVEDAAQAHGSTVGGKKCGSLGLAGAFSFYPGKNLGALGEGGAITTSDHELYTKLLMLRDVGQSEKYHHEVLGYNSRLPSLQAAALDIKLRHLDEQNNARRTCARIYQSELDQVEHIILPPFKENAVYHLYVVRSTDQQTRDELQAHLAADGIATGIHYPIPIHLQAAYSQLGKPRGSYPNTESLSETILSLPLFPGMTEEEIHHVCRSTKRFFEQM